MTDLSAGRDSYAVPPVDQGGDSAVGDTRPSTEEVVKSLTGFDEIAIKQKWGGVEFENLGAFSTLRALVFTLHRRNGLDDGAAHKKAMEQTIAELNESFCDPDPLGKDAAGNA